MANAIKPYVVTHLKGAADIFGWRMMQLQPFHMTHDECLHLVAPSFHHELLKMAASVADLRAGVGDMPVGIPRIIDGVDTPYIDLRMRTHEGNEPPLRPRAPLWQACKPEIQQKVIDWATHHLVTGRKTETVKWVLDWLVEKCDTGAQVRYLWPAVLHLASVSDDEAVVKWTEKYGPRTTPRSLPRVSPEMRKLLGDTSEWCAQAVLLSEIKQVEQHEVVISRNTVYPFTLSVDGRDVVMARAAL